MFGFPSTILATQGPPVSDVPHQSSVMTMTLRVAPRRSSPCVSSDVMVVASRALTKRALLADIWSTYCASVMPCSNRSFVTTTAISSGASSAVRLHYGATWRIAHAIESGLRDAAAPVVDDHAVIQETLEQCVLADRMGFDAIWFVEHHFLTSFSMSPCPEVIFGALSQLTKRIRLGFGVVILPYHHPVRVAERVAMVDHMSGGRVEFGTGRSAPYEQIGMGIDPRNTRAMWEESLRMIPRIWEDGVFSWEGQFWSVPPRDVRPKPYQKPHPRIWVAALQPTTYQIAAELGIGVMALSVAAPSYLAPHIKEYKERVRHAKPAGKFINDQWLSSAMAICDWDNKGARELAAKSLRTFFGPDRPYLKDQTHLYEQLVSSWGGVPEHLKANFARYVKDEKGATGAPA